MPFAVTAWVLVRCMSVDFGAMFLVCHLDAAASAHKCVVAWNDVDFSFHAKYADVITSTDSVHSLDGICKAP